MCRLSFKRSDASLPLICFIITIPILRGSSYRWEKAFSPAPSVQCSSTVFSSLTAFRVLVDYCRHHAARNAPIRIFAVIGTLPKSADFGISSTPSSPPPVLWFFAFVGFNFETATMTKRSRLLIDDTV